MIFKNGRCFVDGRFKNVDIQVVDGKITNIAECIDAEDVIDCKGKNVIPGYVDIHTHGCDGEDFSTSTVEGIEKMLHCYAKNGTTSVLATTVSLSNDDVKTAVDNINKVKTEATEILGINLEGPFISPNKRGAHDENVLCCPTAEFIEGLENIKEVCVAPELDGAFEFIKNFDGLCSVAHTACDYKMANMAFDAGAKHVTHLFNAMNGFNHRGPGVIGAFFDSKDAVAELICDGVHVDECVVRTVFKVAAERTAIISDSMSACGLGDGQYKLGNLDVTVKNAVATLSDSTIAGSTTFVGEMVRRLIKFGVAIETIILSATKIPADSIGVHNKGRLEVGCDADILVCDDSFNIEKVFINGKQAC